MQLERAAQRRLDRPHRRILLAGMRGIAVPGDVHPGEQSHGVEPEFQHRVRLYAQSARQRDHDQVLVAGQVVGVAAGLPRGGVVIRPVPFKRQEDVAAGPAPVQAVDDRVQRVVRSQPVRVGVVGLRLHTHGKTRGDVSPGRDAGRGLPPQWLLGAEIAMPARRVGPGAIRPLQAQARQQQVQPRHRQRAATSVGELARAVHHERLTGRHDLQLDPRQRRPTSRREPQQPPEHPEATKETEATELAKAIGDGLNHLITLLTIGNI